MTGISGALRLRRIAAALRAGRMPDPEDAVPLADAIDAYFEGDDLMAALGIAAQGRGGVSARRAVLLFERDEALLELTDLLGGEIAGEDSEGVWNLAEALEGYVDPDVRDIDKAHTLVATIIRASGKPIGRRQIANILSPYFNPD